MRLRYLKTGWLMTIGEMLRNRIILILLLVIPSVFFTITRLTTPIYDVFFKLASLSEETYVQVSLRSEALVFIGIATVGLLAAFLALNLIQKSDTVNRRLILCGYSTGELALTRFGVLLFLLLILGAYICLISLLFFQPRHLFQMYIGFFSTGYVYGAYGLFIGAMVRRELEGILLVVLLANIDIGWLQNPVFYADAQSKIIIHYLPAFCPSQVSMIAAFTDYSILKPLAGSLLYRILFLVAAFFIFWTKIRIYR